MNETPLESMAAAAAAAAAAVTRSLSPNGCE